LITQKKSNIVYSWDAQCNHIGKWTILDVFCDHIYFFVKMYLITLICNQK